MAIVRTAVAAKLEANPNFHLKIHQDQMIQIKAVHPLVNSEGKKRLADFTVECSDPDFVLIMENLSLKRVLNIMAVCNPTITLEFKMDIGISKNQIGCADPFGACYVKCNSAGRNKNQPRYIQYPSDAKDTPNNNNTNVPTPAIEIKIEKQTESEQPAAVSKRRGRPSKPPKKIKEEVIKPVEVPPAQSRSLKDFFEQIPLDPQLSSPQPTSNNNTNEINIEEQHNSIVVEQVGADVDPVESPSQVGSVLSAAPPVEIQQNITPSVNIEDAVPIEESNASAADPINTDNSFMDQTINEDRQQNQQEISENSAKKNDEVPQDIPTVDNVDKNVMDQIPVDADLTTLEVNQFANNVTEDDKNNTTDDSLLNQDEMAEIFKEIFPEYYGENKKNDEVNNEYSDINSMLFNTDQSSNAVPMETETALQVEISSVVRHQQPDPESQQQQPMQIEEAAITSIQPSTEVVNAESNGQCMQNEVQVEKLMPQTEVSEQVAPTEVQPVANEEDGNIDKSIVAATPVNNVDNMEVAVNTESSGNVPNAAEVWSGIGVPLAAAAQPTQPTAEVVPESTEVTRVIENVNSEVPQVNATSSNNSEKKIANVNTEAIETIQQNSESPSESVDKLQDPARDEPKIAAVELNTSDEVAQQTIDAQPQQVDIEQNTVNNADESVPDTTENLNEQKEDQSNLNFNAVPTDHAIIAADEDLDLNEIVYDGEIVVASEDEDEEEKAQFIDFFCEETLADDEREEEDSTNNEYNMIDDGPQVTRKRKRGFSLESVVFRNVKQKVQHVTVKQEAKSTPEKESLQNISKDSQMSPIMRAIFASKMRKNNMNNNNNENNSPRITNNTTRRVTRSAVKNSSNSSEDSIESTSHNINNNNNNNKTKKNKNNNGNKRRASSHHETSLKKENQAVDSPRILIYNERTLRRGPLPKMEKREKKETKPKKEAKVKVDKKAYSNEEEKSKYSDEDYMSINSDEDSVEYHVDKLSEDEYFVEEILEKKVEKGKTQYLIKWLGWPHSDNTWTPEEDISPDIIEIYETSPKQRNPGERNVLVYNLFWKYAFRRHVRYVKEHPEDPNYENCKDIDVSDGLLDKFSMCNCYRVLDAGSIYFKEQVARMKREEDEDDVTKQTIWMAFCYRLVNRLTTFEGFGRIPTSRQWSQFKKYLINIRATGDPVFTNRHNVIGLENYLGVMDNLTSKIDVLYEKFERRKTSLQKCIEYAQTLPFIGPFFAQQICNDLVEEGIINSSNSWVCLGPGAKAGLRNIYPGIKNSELLDRAKQLQKNQRKAFASLDFDFPYYEGRDLSLIDIEHVLCEFQKYLRMLGKKSSKKNLRAKFKNNKAVKKHRNK